MDGVNFSTALSNVLNSSDGSINELKAINAAILAGDGIDQIIESIAEEHPDLAKALKNNKNTLKKPDVETQKLMGENLNLSADIAKKLGVNQNATIGEVFDAAFSKISQQANKQNAHKADTALTLNTTFGTDTTSETSSKNNFFGLQNLTSEVIDLMCILLCQESKSQLVETLKEVLKQKVSARQELSSEHLQKTQDSLTEQVEAQKKAAEAKKASIFKSIFSAIASVVGCIIGVATTVATLGAGSALGIAMIGLSVASLGCTLVSSSCSIAATCIEDQDTKNTLNKVALGCGIGAAVVGLAASVGNLAGGALKGALEATKIVGKNLIKGLSKSILKIAKTAAKSVAKETIKNSSKLSKGIQISGNIASALATIAEGAAEIYSGAINIQAAKIQKELANLKIDIAKLDQEIATLAAFIETITQDIQKFIENILNCERNAVEALHARTDTEQKISQQIA